MSNRRSALARIGANAMADWAPPLAMRPEDVTTAPWPLAQPASPARLPNAAAPPIRRRRSIESVGCDSIGGSLKRLFVQRQQGEAGEPVFAHIVVIQVRQSRVEVRLRGSFEPRSQRRRRGLGQMTETPGAAQAEPVEVGDLAVA